MDDSMNQILITFSVFPIFVSSHMVTRIYSCNTQNASVWPIADSPLLIRCFASFDVVSSPSRCNDILLLYT